MNSDESYLRILKRYIYYWRIWNKENNNFINNCHYIIPNSSKEAFDFIYHFYRMNVMIAEECRNRLASCEDDLSIRKLIYRIYYLNIVANLTTNKSRDALLLHFALSIKRIEAIDDLFCNPPMDILYKLGLPLNRDREFMIRVGTILKTHILEATPEIQDTIVWNLPDQYHSDNTLVFLSIAVQQMAYKIHITKLPSILHWVLSDTHPEGALLCTSGWVRNKLRKFPGIVHSLSWIHKGQEEKGMLEELPGAVALALAERDPFNGFQGLPKDVSKILQQDIPDGISKKGPHPSLDDPNFQEVVHFSEVNPEELLLTKLEIEQLKKILSEKDIDAFELLAEGYSYEEIAQQEGVKPNTIKSRLYRARQRLEKIKDIA